MYRASAVSYAQHVGDVPDGLHICHTCDNPRCINPAHLFLGTPKDNQQDSLAKGRHAGHRTAGESNSQAKLDAISVREIFTAEGTITSIAEQYGVSFQLVSMIKHRKVWRHLCL